MDTLLKTKKKDKKKYIYSRTRVPVDLINAERYSVFENGYIMQATFSFDKHEIFNWNCLKCSDEF